VGSDKQKGLIVTLVKRMLADRRGSVGIIFGLSFLPMLGMVGAAVDYTRAVQTRARLQTAIDSAVLAAARDGAQLTDAQLSARAKAFVDANLAGNSAPYTLDNLAVTRAGKTIYLSGKATIATSILPVVGINSISVTGNAQSTWGTTKIELALVLDNTGSMGSSGKMPALKTAAKSLIDILNAAATSDSNIKIGIVPFDTNVRIGTAYSAESWLRFSPYDPVAEMRATPATWTGCVSDRDQPYDAGDATADPAQNMTLYPAVNCPNTSLATVMPLTALSPTSNAPADALKARIDTMQPSGWTNVTIGTSWGMAMLSSGQPLTEAMSASANPDLVKHMIVLTDGDNTRNRWTTSQNSIDDRTKLACASAKQAGITVHTIRVIDGNASLLRDCATSPSNYYNVQNAAELTPVFKAIASQIGRIRITN
jgi:Flp pilus assembly protein TadG